MDFRRRLTFRSPETRRQESRALTNSLIDFSHLFADLVIRGRVLRTVEQFRLTFGCPINDSLKINFLIDFTSGAPVVTS
ncbi:unnamed protein product [Leptosia nina]|uniref:Uncharacterized protein n=1 Tax=Leptosia nina TaxID=320188 RepID=A0AAV1J0K4_9NEOP